MDSGGPAGIHNLDYVVVGDVTVDVLAGWLDLGEGGYLEVTRRRTQDIRYRLFVEGIIVHAVGRTTLVPLLLNIRSIIDWRVEQSIVRRDALGEARRSIELPV